MATTRRSLPAATKWLSYRLPPAMGLVVFFIFIARDELLRSTLPGVALIVTVMVGHMGISVLGFFGFLLLCAGVWWLADLFDRPELWRPAMADQAVARTGTSLDTTS